jgi:hypothetical protein
MKRLIIPVIILIVFVLIWVIQSSYEKKRISGEMIENFLELNQENVNKIVIHTAADTVTIIKENDNWFLQGQKPQKADNMVMNNVLTAAETITVGQVYSENPALQGSFQVDTLSGTRVEFYDSDRLLSSIIIGKLTQDYSHTYVRIPGSNEVYIADGVLTYTFNRKRAQWLDKTIFAIDPGTVRNIEIVHSEKSYKLWHGDTDWYIAKEPYKDSIIADSSKAGVFLTQLCYLKASDLINANDSGKINFDKPSLKFDLSTADGSRHMVEFAEIKDSTASRFYCRKADREDTLVVSKPIYSTLSKEFADFMPEGQ